MKKNRQFLIIPFLFLNPITPISTIPYHSFPCQISTSYPTNTISLQNSSHKKQCIPIMMLVCSSDREKVRIFTMKAFSLIFLRYLRLIGYCFSTILAYFLLVFPYGLAG